MDAATSPVSRSADPLPRVASSDACGSFCTDGSVGEPESLTAGGHRGSGASGDLSPAAASVDSAKPGPGNGDLVAALAELLEKTPNLDWADDEEDSWFLDAEEAELETERTTPATTPQPSTERRTWGGSPGKGGRGPQASWAHSGKGEPHRHPQGKGKGKGKGGKGTYGLVPSPVKYPATHPQRESPKAAQWAPAPSPQAERGLWQEIGALRGCSDPSSTTSTGRDGNAPGGSTQDWRCGQGDHQSADRFGGWQSAPSANPFSFKPKHAGAFAKKKYTW
eukprot:EG_transcript_20903